MTSDANDNRLDNIDARIAALFQYLEQDRIQQQQRAAEFDARLQEMSAQQERRSAEIDARFAALSAQQEQDRTLQQQRDEAISAQREQNRINQQQQNEAVNAQIAALFRHSDEAWVRDQQRFGLINAQFEEVGNHIAELTLQVSGLVDTVQNLTGRMDRAFEQTERDRAEFREESRRIWAYLQGRNGNQGN